MKALMKYCIVFAFCLGFISVRSQTMQDSIKVPNIFTPNLDGVNDVFKPVISFENKIQSYSMEIYDRFGVNVFKSETNNHHSNMTWDGRTTSGMPCSDGTYFYILQLNANASKMEYKGFVQLFR